MKIGMKLGWMLVVVLAPAVFRATALGGPVFHHAMLRRGRVVKTARWKPAPTFVDFDEPVREFPSNDKSPIWDFWKNVFAAREKLDKDDAQGALELIKNLSVPPIDIVNKGQSFYRRLYRKALETGLEAATRLSASEDTWRRQLWTYYPDRNYDAPESAQPQDKLTRLHLLSQRFLFDDIPDTISTSEIEASEASTEDKCRAFFELGWALQKNGQKEDAAASYGRVADLPCEEKILARSLFWKGSLESDMKNYEAAESTFRLLAKRSDGNRYADDAYYKLSKIYQAQSDDDRAAQAVSSLLKLPEGDMKEKYLWDEAFTAFENQDYDAATDNLDRIIATKSLGTEAQPQAMYWKGRIAEIRSHKKLGGASSGLYHQVLKNYPFSLYALLAEARLGVSAPVPAVTKNKAAVPSDKEFTQALRVVDDLNKRKDYEAARDVLDYLTYVDRTAAAEKPEAIAERWAASGDYNRALELAAEKLDKSLFDINLEKDSPLTRALYPLAYEKIVKSEAEANHLPMPLILGIMREESLFQRSIRSHAGAIGLMQLMPATARIKARGLGVDVGDLTSPENNIRLGSSFLRDLMDRFSDQTPLAVMGYNAGPGNVNKWLASQGSMPLDEFIENVPFTETRGYVKRVLRSAHIYSHLLGGSKRTALIPSMDAPR